MAKEKYSKKNELWATNLIISKLEKHKNRTYMNWSTDLESLKQKLLKDYNYGTNSRRNTKKN